MTPLNGFVLSDHAGEQVELASLWSERPAALVFLRHYLCVQCRVGAMELERDRHLLPSDPNVWLLGMGTPVQAQAFRQQTGVGFPILLSPDLAAYRAMDLPRGSLRQVFGFAAQRVARRRAKGIGLEREAEGGNRPKARPEQDWHQLGGAFVFARGGEVVWSHRARHAGDSPDHGLLGRALRDAGDPSASY
ncbi:MAG TPA: peroxiredoxin-like family protein [Solirubrobacteraceae bacterium]|nr:peroxiredoxin-like family protein [Solirubrobacteraceae bacterium]